MGGGRYLRQREIDVDARLEVYPRNGDALQRRALHVADTIECVTKNKLRIWGNPLSISGMSRAVDLPRIVMTQISGRMPFAMPIWPPMPANRIRIDITMAVS